MMMEEYGKVIQFTPRATISALDTYRKAKLAAERAISRMMLSDHPGFTHYKTIVITLVARAMAAERETSDAEKNVGQIIELPIPKK